MPEWASTLLGVIVGGGLTGLVTLLTLRWQLGEERQRRVEDALRDRREKGAGAVGPVRALLGDVHPDPPMMWVGNPGVNERWRQLVERWDALRDPLVVYATGHPSGEVREAGNRLADAVGRTLSTTGWAMSVVTTHGNLVRAREKALEDHQAAVRLADELVQLVREESV